MKRNYSFVAILALVYSCLEFIMFFIYIIKIGISPYSLRFLLRSILFLLSALYLIFYETYLLVLYNVFVLCIIIFSILFCKNDGNTLIFNIFLLLVIDAVLIFNEVKKK